eukprot:409632_1
MRILSTFLISIVLFSPNALTEEFYPKGGHVIPLTADTFDEVVRVDEHKPVLVEFYAPWCGHCKNMKPEYISAAKKLQGVATFAAVDMADDANGPLSSRFDVKGFPTLMLFMGKNAPIPYNNARQTDQFVKFITGKLTGKFVEKVTSDNQDAFLTKSGPKVLLFSEKSSPASLYKSLSVDFREQFKFGQNNVAKGKELSGKFGVSEFPALIIIPEAKEGVESKALPFPGSLKPMAIRRFLKKFLGHEVTSARVKRLHDQSCLAAVCMAGRPCVMLITNAEAEHGQKALETLEEVAEGRSDGLFKYAVLDGVEHEDYVKQVFDLSLDYTRLVVFNYKKKVYASYMGNFDQSSIDSFITGMMTGRQRSVKIILDTFPTLKGDTKKCEVKETGKPKSAKPKSTPKKDKKKRKPFKDAVVTLTDKNFDDTIRGSDLPVMVEFYAPWCGHCKHLEPEWKKAADNLKGMVVFAKVDATQEQSLGQRFQVKGYPTIKYFTAGKREGDLVSLSSDYQGPRSSKALKAHAINMLSVGDAYLVQSTTILEKVFTKKAGKSRVILFTEKSKIPLMIRALAVRFSGVNFIVVESKVAEAVSNFNIESFPSIVHIPSGVSLEEAPKSATKFADEIDFMNLVKWVKSLVGDAPESTPKEPDAPVSAEVEQLESQADFQKLCFDRLGLCGVVFLDEDSAEDVKSGKSSYIKTLKMVQQKNPDRTVRFVWISRANQDALTKAFGLADSPVSLVLLNARKLRYASFMGSFSAENIHQFVSDVKSGQVRTHRIDSVPEIKDTVTLDLKEEL